MSHIYFTHRGYRRTRYVLEIPPSTLHMLDLLIEVLV